METETSPSAASHALNNNLDAVPIIEDDQQLYDWGIEHRLDQYYGEQPPPHHHGHQQNYQYKQQPPPQQQQQQPQYVLPEHIQQQENAYLVTITASSSPTDDKSKTVLPASPLVKSENKTSSSLRKNIRPNGIPGRRPMLPTVDMDANELLKVERKRARNRVAASKCRMRKLERIAVLDQQANQLRAENEQLVKLADKLRSQVYSLKQELRWHINNGCRLQPSSSVDQIDQQEVPVTVDKATETSLTNAQFEMYDNSPDSTTSSIVCNIKKEPINYLEQRSSL